MTAMIKVLMVVLPVMAQSPSSTVDLADPFIDASFGFSVRPPEGWLIDAERVYGEEGVTLLKLTEPKPGGGRSVMTVEMSPAPAGVADVAQAALDEWLHRMSQKQPAARLARAATQPAGESAAPVWTIETIVDRRPMVAIRAAIAAPAARTFAITLTCAPAARERGEALVEAVAATFKLVDDPQSEAKIKNALVRTSAWLKSIESIELADKLQPEACLRVLVNGKEQGYVLLTEAPFTFQDADGVRLVEEGWIFGESGDIRRLHHAIFLSDDRRTESWENQVVIVTPATPREPKRLDLVWQEGLREDTMLLTSQSTQYGQSLRNNPHIRLPSGYVSRLLVRWLPRLTDLSTPALLAYTTYDFDRNGLVLRTIELAGRDPGRSGPVAFTVRDREGTAGMPTEMQFDQSGRLLRLSTGSVTWERADASTVRRWEPRVIAAQREIDELEKDYQRSLKRFTPAKR